MTLQLSLDEGKILVNLARQTVNHYLKKDKVLKVPENVSTKLKEKYGVFVTLNKIVNGTKKLRGCIGFPYPTIPLANAVIDAAINASTQDPRFPLVTIEELNQIVFEVSILTSPEQIIVNQPIDYISNIKIGNDGLIIENSYHKGLLLPQVPVELNWDVEEYLCQVSMKAGLSCDAWLLKKTRIYRFQAIIFEEKTPKGIIKQKKI
ncbi:TIGR00296 family protein [Candidatus Bathyarchaeota archaeon]|nr:TIGR00296 family protein [Candidatus Bathyarchaeota archaeon]